jgi:hypothetical protein
LRVWKQSSRISRISHKETQWAGRSRGKKREKEMELPSLPGCGQFIMSQTEIAKVVFSGELDRYRVARQTL